jgi:DNA-binding transcriptional LysR family regulator
MDRKVYGAGGVDITERDGVTQRPPLPVTNASLFDLNLNLLNMFDVLIQERSVTRASHRLGLSQPAVSQALSRLRQILNDELFIRTPDGMQPTLRALEMSEPVRDALRMLQLTLTPKAFDPTCSSLKFKILVSNYAARVVVPPLVHQVVDVAPNVALDIRTIGAMSVFDQLDTGGADVALGRLADGGERFKCVRILDDDYVVLLDQQHPAASETEMSIERLAEVPHVDITSTGDDISFVDDALRRYGKERKIVVRVPLLSIVLMLLGADRLAVVPRHAAHSLLAVCPLTMRELPFSSPRMELSMIWHRRLDSHSAQRWLRNMIRASVAIRGCPRSSMRTQFGTCQRL